ncbi:MAG TPA: FAD-binding oxidoreductase [Rhodospirillales bacterium]|jgi:D-lactate dehydrogenase (cytochrome)|nr:FAD-binding oxidoreductase [Rhodospirillales bacterium]
MTITENFSSAIKDAVGPKGWSTDDDRIEAHVTERRGLWHGQCDLVVSPASTEEVAQVMSICHDAGVAVVPQGGNTGLVGGGVPEGGIALSLARLNTVRGIDAANNTMTVDAGCILADVQAAAEAEDRLFPLSLGAEGSCQIGGNLSTNAGGVQVLRYGNARDLVLGLEVVLPDGRVWDGLKALRKDNTGYDLKHLFIGAEGTLGVITAAVLKLYPLPQCRETALAALGNADKALALFQRVGRFTGDALTAFEYINHQSLDIAVTHIPGLKDPFEAAHECYALIELSGPDGIKDALEQTLAGAMEDGLVDDAVIAASGAQAAELWHIRETIPEAQVNAGASIKHDVSVPISKVPAFLVRAQQIVEAEIAGIRVVAFGHLGDGNIHFNLSQPEDKDGEAFLAEWGRINRLVHDLVDELGGSFSAEHGIGVLKKDDLKRYTSAVELELMQTLKQTLDPKGIMNPGKVL